jgi:hypothetical protein
MRAALFDCVGVRLHALPLEWQMHPYFHRASFWRDLALKELGEISSLCECLYPLARFHVQKPGPLTRTLASSSPRTYPLIGGYVPGEVARLANNAGQGEPKAAVGLGSKGAGTRLAL